MSQLVAPGQKLIEEQLPDGRRVYRSAIPLLGDLPDIFARLVTWAAEQQDKVLLSEPGEGARRSISYSEALCRARTMRQRLAGLYSLRKGDCVATLAPAGIDALVLKLACLSGGFVHAALPPFPFRDGVESETTKPFVENAKPRLIVAPPGHPAIEGMDAVSLDELARDGTDGTAPGADEQASPDDWAAIFFTSGSTGAPKGVPITRGMISSNQGAIAAMWPFVAETPPVLVDWLPWHHVFGGLDNIFKVIWNGGAMHVDAAPGSATIEATAKLMAEVAPTMHIAVPLGLKLLLDRLEMDEDGARALTRKLRAIFFAGAGIDAELWRRLAAFRDSHGDFQILSGYGATEAASTITLSPAPLERPGELGHPLPGHSVALADVDGRSELRVSGPNIAPCYLIDGRRVELPVDEHGFYRTGDAAVLRQRLDGVAVFGFDGRLAEDFKLSSGVKVRTGPLRAGLLAQCAPLADDIVISGENRDRLVALVFPSAVGKARLEEIGARIAGWNAANPSGSTVIARFDFAIVPADRAKGELSDKGQIVQSRYLRNHANLFEALQVGGGQAPKGA
ncbi:feruloyl-CoA synthase [Aminobacter lissarensis]|uniref:Feruloyl-CoA synthase n=1 Tax=Aminobacter carboxidus TaxID=376165 RepID=A0A8E1WMB5_9HYPH|nr:AMP-binding protein [Aminobacter lissarensis]MBB6470186.1 feruloyl-CoA synthase [Aminobacter lissarensis]